MDPSQTYDLFHKDNHNFNPAYYYPKARDGACTTKISKSISRQKAPETATWIPEDVYIREARDNYNGQNMPSTGLVLARDDSWPLLTEVDTISTFTKHIITAVNKFMIQTHNDSSSKLQFTTEYSMTLEGVEKVDAETKSNNKYVVVRPDGIWCLTYTDEPVNPASLDPANPPSGGEFFPNMKGGKPSRESVAYTCFEGKRVGVVSSCCPNLEEVAKEGLSRNGKRRRWRHAAKMYQRRKTFQKKSEKLLKQPLAYAKAFGVQFVVMYDYKTMALFRFPELLITAETTAADLWKQEVKYVEVTLIKDRAKMVPALAGFLHKARREMRSRPTASRAPEDAPGTESQEDSAAGSSDEGKSADENDNEGGNEDDEDDEDEEMSEAEEAALAHFRQKKLAKIAH